MPPSLSARFQPIRDFVGTDAYWLAVGMLALLTVVPGANSEGYFQTGKMFVLLAVTLLTATSLWLNRARFRFSAPRPVLWLGGSESDYIRDSDVPEMKALFPRAVRVTVRGASHWVHADQPEAVVSAVRTFLTAD